MRTDFRFFLDLPKERAAATAALHCGLLSGSPLAAVHFSLFFFLDESEKRIHHVGRRLNSGGDPDDGDKGRGGCAESERIKG